MTVHLRIGRVWGSVATVRTAAVELHHTIDNRGIKSTGQFTTNGSSGTWWATDSAPVTVAIGNRLSNGP